MAHDVRGLISRWMSHSHTNFSTLRISAALATLLLGKTCLSQLVPLPGFPINKFLYQIKKPILLPGCKPGTFNSKKAYKSGFDRVGCLFPLKLLLRVQIAEQVPAVSKLDLQRVETASLHWRIPGCSDHVPKRRSNPLVPVALTVDSAPLKSGHATGSAVLLLHRLQRRYCLSPKIVLGRGQPEQVQ